MSQLSSRRFGRAQEGVDWVEARLVSREQTGQVIDPVLCAMQRLRYSCKDILAVHITLEEAIVNAIRHGNLDDPRKRVIVRYHVDPDCVRAEVEDQGTGFNPDRVPDPLLADNMERPSGRGLLLMRSLMNWVRFNSQGNRVSFCRFRQPQGSKLAS